LVSKVTIIPILCRWKAVAITLPSKHDGLCNRNGRNNRATKKSKKWTGLK